MVDLPTGRYEELVTRIVWQLDFGLPADVFHAARVVAA